VLWACGPREQPEPKDTVTQQWAREFAGRERDELLAPQARSATPEEFFSDLAELDRRILALAAGQLPEATPDYDSLIQELQRGVRRAAVRRELEREAAYRLGLAALYHQMGSPDAAAEQVNAVFELARGSIPPVWSCAAYMLRGDILRKKGDYADSLVAYGDAVRFCGERGDWERARRAAEQIDVLCAAPESRAAMDETSRPDGRLMDRMSTRGLAEYCRFLLLREQAPAEAFAALESAEETFASTDLIWLNVVYARKAQWLLEGRDPLGAAAVLETAIDLRRELNDTRGLVDAYLRLGIARDHDETGDQGVGGADMYRQAYRLAEEFDLAFEEAAALNYLGLNLARRGRARWALACFIQAASLSAQVAAGTPLVANIEANLNALQAGPGGEEAFQRLRDEVVEDHEAILAEATAM